MTATDGLRHRAVGEVVAEDYARAATFKRFGIDFCCGGDRTVEAACERAGITVEEVETALLQASNRTGRGWPDAREWDPVFLSRYIVGVHHQYVRETLPTLIQFSQKVAQVHGEGRPELLPIRTHVAELSAEMEQHMTSEEAEVFPRIERAVSAHASGQSSSEADLESAIRGLEAEHEHAGALVGQIRVLSDDYTPPATACATYRALYAKLAEFEEDLHRHVHLENNILFPKVVELAEQASPTA